MAIPPNRRLSSSRLSSIVCPGEVVIGRHVSVEVEACHLEKGTTHPLPLHSTTLHATYFILNSARFARGAKVLVYRYVLKAWVCLSEEELCRKRAGYNSFLFK